MKKIITTICATLFLFLIVAPIEAVETEIYPHKWATDAEATAQSRDDVGLTPANISAIPLGSVNATGVVWLVANGGTESVNATGARANLSAAKSGVNTDITSMTGLDDDGIPLAKVANAASDGNNTDITHLSGPALGIPASGNLTNCDSYPSASITSQGVSERSTDAEAVAGTDTERHVTPANLTARLAEAGIISGVADPTDANGVGDRGFNDNRYTGRSYGIMWNENQDTYIRIGDPYLFIHDDMKRCILADNGTVVYYLEEDTSYNRDGVAPSVAGTCDANATNKITDAGIFTEAAADYVGRYVHDTTADVYAMITAKDDNDTLSLQEDIFVIGDTFEVCTAVLDGTDGQVMVEILAFYHKYSYKNGWHQHSISYDQLFGYTLHHAFQKNGANVTARYMSAYEGVLYDTTESKYVNGLYLPSNASYQMSFNGTTETITSDTLTHPFTNLEAGVDKIVISGTANNNLTVGLTAVTDTTITTDGNLTDEGSVACIVQVQRDWTGSTGDVLGSVSGKVPMNYGTRAQFRAIAANKGTGWRQQSFDLVSAVQLLYLVEYGSWYSRSEIGPGLTDWGSGVWDAWNNINPIERTGLSNGRGNGTWNVSNGVGAKGSYMSYRGIENFYGHVWKWVDGININSNVPYVSNTDTQFADGTATNCTALGVTLANTNGYQKTLAQIARGFLPASVGGSSSTYITDYYYQSTGWRVARLGGGANDGARAGAAYWGLDGPVGTAIRYTSARVSW